MQEQVGQRVQAVDEGFNEEQVPSLSANRPAAQVLVEETLDFYFTGGQKGKRMITYRGYRKDDGSPVIVKTIDDQEETELRERTDLFPAGEKHLEFGYQGNGPLRTAIAILSSCMNDQVAVQGAGPFMVDIISRLPKEGFTMTDSHIATWVLSRFTPAGLA